MTETLNPLHLFRAFNLDYISVAERTHSTEAEVEKKIHRLRLDEILLKAKEESRRVKEDQYKQKRRLYSQRHREEMRTLRAERQSFRERGK